MTSYHLNKWRPTFLTHMCVTWSRRFDNLFQGDSAHHMYMPKEGPWWDLELTNDITYRSWAFKNCIYWDRQLSRVPCITCPLRWRHNELAGVSDHQPNDCLLNRLFGRRSKKTSKLRVTGLCAGNSPWPVNSPHKRPVTRKMFPFDDVIMSASLFYHPGFPI